MNLREHASSLFGRMGGGEDTIRPWRRSSARAAGTGTRGPMPHHIEGQFEKYELDYLEHVRGSGGRYSSSFHRAQLEYTDDFVDGLEVSVLLGEAAAAVPVFPEPPRHRFIRGRNPWDIHIYFTDGESKRRALSVRAGLMEAFPWLRAHKPCWDTPVGPHPQPMVEIDFDVPENASELQAVVGWLAREHGGLSVLVHPNTLDGGVADHTDHAIWLGPPLQPILAVLGG